MKRIKAPSLSNWLEFEGTVDEIAQLTVELRSAEAARDTALQTLRETIEPEIAAIGTDLKARVLAAEKYAAEHRGDLLPGKSKSRETPLAIWGFRTGMPALKPLAKWTWAKVLAKFQESCWAVYLRPKWEVDKAAILAAAPKRKDGTFTKLGTPLSDFGLKVVQEETFFVEPKDKPTEGVL